MSFNWIFKSIHLYVQAPPSSTVGKRSIFARQIAAQRLKEGKTPLHCAPEAAHTPEHREQNLPPETNMDTDDRESLFHNFCVWELICGILLHRPPLFTFCCISLCLSLPLLSTHQSQLQFHVSAGCLVRGSGPQVAQENR